MKNRKEDLIFSAKEKNWILVPSIIFICISLLILSLSIQWEQEFGSDSNKPYSIVLWLSFTLLVWGIPLFILYSKNDRSHLIILSIICDLFIVLRLLGGVPRGGFFLVLFIYIPLMFLFARGHYIIIKKYIKKVAPNLSKNNLFPFYRPSRRT